VRAIGGNQRPPRTKRRPLIHIWHTEKNSGDEYFIRKHIAVLSGGNLDLKFGKVKY
jgi:hypothetical protein